MDDAEVGITRSLLWRLSVWIGGTILVVGAAAGVLSFLFAFQQARDLQDDQLREIAWLVSPEQGPMISSTGGYPYASEPETRIVLLSLPGLASPAGGSEVQPMLPGNLASGLSTVTSNGKTWRVYVRDVSPGQRLAVAQRTSARDAIARDGSLRTLAPMMLLVPILVLLTALLIRLTLRRISVLSGQLDAKGDTDLVPLSLSRLPAEIVPFAQSINSLLDRLRQALEARQRFVAEAAHELRSPVTALMLQIENFAAEKQHSDEDAARLVSIGTSVNRMAALVEQLLQLSRVQGGPPALRTQIDALQVVRDVIGELLPFADARSSDLGMDQREKLTIVGDESDFRALVRNLIDNAIRYSPCGARIDVSLYRAGNSAVLEVVDDGPGIPEDEINRVMDPFYRIAGSTQPGTGLGLTIVTGAAERLGGRLILQNVRTREGGLLVRYMQPAADQTLLDSNTVRLHHNEPGRAGCSS